MGDEIGRSAQPNNDISERIDRLTGVYNYVAAREEADRLLKCGMEGAYSCILIRLQKVEALDTEYGNTFTGAVIENTATYIKHQYLEKTGTAVVGRLSRDTFVVFEFGRSLSYTERTVKWLREELKKGYFGRHTGIEIGIAVGIWYGDSTTISDAVYSAGKALEYADKYNSGVEIYDPERETEYGTIADGYLLIRATENDERLYDYDNRLVSFAVAMLANAKDPQSSLDVILQRLAWKGGFNHVLACKFEDNHYVRVISRYMKGEGIVIDDHEEIADMNDWDEFIRSFDSSGLSKLDDTEAPYLSENDREFFKVRNIGSALNFLLFDNGNPSGYLSLCSAEKNRGWSGRDFDTFSQISKLVGIFLSLRIRRENEEKRLRELSKDFVTGLYVYASFHSEAEKLLKNYDESKKYAFMYMDIDNFSYINTTYGYEAGNKALKAIAQYLESACGKDSICAHLQADKFVALIVMDTRAEIEETVKRIGTDLYTSQVNDGGQCRLRSSTGLYFIEKNDIDPARAVELATQVWKSVKNDRNVLYRIYDEEFKRTRMNRLDVIGSYQQAIRDGEITAFLQPKFSMKNRETVGAEALCRWQMPSGRFRFPNEFIPALEENGQIIEIDFCVYEQILKAIRRWKENGKHLIPVSVNFSRVHLDHDDFADRIIGLAKYYEVDPKYIEIEITESTVSMSSEHMLETMQKLRDNGFKIDMDDFGTGYSSLNMLIEAPIDIVKVDKSFIDKYKDPVYRDYIDRIGSLITTAKKGIIFEGVETEDQIKFLIGCGYDNAQGYAYSRPISVKEFEENYLHNEA